MRRFLAIVLLLLPVASRASTLHAAEVREWTDQTGSVKKTGEFERLDGKRVHIKLAGGESLKVPLDWLSDADQAFAKAAAGAAIPADAVNVVIVEGVGLDVESARKDAYRAAVRQVLGTLVDSETLVENDRLVTDKVVLFSNGFVEKVDPLPDGETKDGGLVRLRVKASVKAGRMAESLRGNNITPTGSLATVADPRSLLAQALTEQDRRENARELFLAAVADYPANCLTAEVGKPKIVEVKDGVAQCDVRIKVSANQKEYDEFVRRLVTFLESGRIEAQGRFALSSDPNNAPPREAVAELLPKQTVEFLDTAWRAGNQTAFTYGQTFSWPSDYLPSIERTLHDSRGQFRLRTQAQPGVLVVYRSEGTAYEGRWFMVPPEILSWSRDLARQLICRVVVRDGPTHHAAAELILKQFGHADTTPRTRNPDCETTFLFPGWHLQVSESLLSNNLPGLFGPVLEFTTRLEIPQQAFDSDRLDIHATLAPPSGKKAAVAVSGGPEAILADVLEKQARATHARGAFLAAAKDYPASCFRAEAFPFNDKSLRVTGDDVECDVRVRISARPKEYEQFAKTLIAFLETLPPEAQCTCEVPATESPYRIPTHRTCTTNAFVTTPPIADRLVAAFDQQGDNPLLSFGSAWLVYGEHRGGFDRLREADGPLQFDETCRASMTRTNAELLRVCVIPATTPPYVAHWYALLPEHAKQFTDVARSMACTVAIRRDAARAGLGVVSLRQLGIAAANDQTNACHSPWGAFFFVPAGITQIGNDYHARQPFMHPTFEFTVPVVVPRAAFGQGMTVDCTLTNGTEETTSP